MVTHRRIVEYDEAIGWRYLPDLKVRVPHEGGGYLVKTNNEGFRCEHDVTSEKPPGTFRILLFGDSFTAGDGVSNQQRYGDLLESRFDNVQILNFGLGGSGTDQQYLIFKQYTDRLDYDLIMISPLVENIRRVSSRYRPVTAREEAEEGFVAKPYFELVNDRLELRNSPVPKGLFKKEELSPHDLQYVDFGGPSRRLRSFVTNRLAPLRPLIQRLYRFQPVPGFNTADNPQWVLMSAVLKQWISERGEHGCVLCPLPLYHHVEGTASSAQYRQRFSELGNTTDGEIWDPLPALLQLDIAKRRSLRFHSDPHLNREGHKVLADAIEPYLAAYLQKVQS